MGQLTGGIDPAVTQRLAREIAEVAAMGCRIGIVVGGGNMVRGEAVSARGGDRVRGDHMGMLATMINGLALAMACERYHEDVRVRSNIPIPLVCPSFNQTEARTLFDRGAIVIFVGGMGHPYFTTDASAALKAAEMTCEILLKATKVDGVYSDDPVTHADAIRYDRLSYADAMAKDLQVMDQAAIALARDNGIEIGVFSLLEPGAIPAAVRAEVPMTVIGA